MAKHVCPVCETVYAERGVLKLETINQSIQYENWSCPSCNYRFMAVSDVQNILETIAGKDAPKVMVHLQVQNT